VVSAVHLFVPILLSAAAAGVLVWFLVGLRPTGRQRWSATWISQRGAYISPELRREVEDIRWRQQAGLLVGMMAGFTIAVPVSFRFDPAVEESMLPALAILFVPVASGCVGEAASGLVGAIRESAGPIRVAASRRARLSDVVSTAGLILMRLQMAVLIVGGLAATQLPRWSGIAFSPRQAAFLHGAVIVVVLVWATAELVARRLLARPLTSSDPMTLYWRNALREDRVSDICRLPVLLGYLAPMIISESIPRTYGTPAMYLGPTLVFGFSVVVLGLTLTSQLLLQKAPRAQRRAAGSASRAFEQA
jgi:hypothetical protein